MQWKNKQHQSLERFSTRENPHASAAQLRICKTYEQNESVGQRKLCETKTKQNANG